MVPMPWMLIPLKSSNVVSIIQYVSAGFRVQSAEPLCSQTYGWGLDYFKSSSLNMNHHHHLHLQLSPILKLWWAGRAGTSASPNINIILACATCARVWNILLQTRIPMQCPEVAQKRWYVMHTSVHFKCHQYLSNSERNGRNSRV